MTQPAKAQEPSMEEILASIRRIISDDETPTETAPSQTSVPASMPSPTAEVMTLAQTNPNGAAAIKKDEPLQDESTHSAIQDEIESILGDPGKTPDNGDWPKPLAQDAQNADDADDVLELTEEMTASPQQPPVFRTIDGKQDAAFGEIRRNFPDNNPEPPALAIAQPSGAAQSESPYSLEGSALLSSAATAAVDTAFSSLAHTVLTQNGRTIDDLVREMIRPMLKGWLDDNLPGLVERLVRAEIERVSRGGR